MKMMPQGRFSHGFVVSPEGFLWIIGGFSEDRVVNSCYRCGLGGEWEEIEELPMDCGGNGAICYWTTTPGEYCVGCVSGYTAMLEQRVMVYNSSMSESELPLGEWTCFNVGQGILPLKTRLQAFLWEQDEVLVLSSEGEICTITFGGEMKAKKIPATFKKPFETTASFALFDDTIGILGDGTQWNVLKTDIIKHHEQD